jgi:hypothetical protein
MMIAHAQTVENGSRSPQTCFVVMGLCAPRRYGYLLLFTYIVELITSSSICHARDCWRDRQVDGSVTVTVERMPVFRSGSSQKGEGLLELCAFVYTSPVHAHKLLLMQVFLTLTPSMMPITVIP